MCVFVFFSLLLVDGYLSLRLNCMYTMCISVSICCRSNITVFIKSKNEKGIEKKGRSTIATTITIITTMRDLFFSMKVFIQLSNGENTKHTSNDTFAYYCISRSLRSPFFPFAFGCESQLVIEFIYML